MVAKTYDGTYDGTSAYSDGVVEDRSAYRQVGETTFLWIAWALAFAFWAFSMSTFFGILRAVT